MVKSAANNQSNLSKDVEIVLKTINDITRNQFIIDDMLLIQGVNFIIHPQEAHKGIIETLSIVIFFAALGILIGFALSHGFKKHNLRTIISAFLFIIISVVLYFNSSHLAPTFHYFIALAIISSGIINILNTYHLDKLNHARQILKSELASKENKDIAMHDVTVALERNTKLQAERILSPAIILSGKVAKFRYGQIIVNFMLIITGVLMLFFRLGTNAVLIRVSGVILIFSAISDFIAIIWTHRESKFVKKITHYNNK